MTGVACAIADAMRDEGRERRMAGISCAITDAMRETPAGPGATRGGRGTAGP